MKLLINIWLKMTFCVTNKVEINSLQGQIRGKITGFDASLQGYSTFVTDAMSQNTLYLLRV